jgi:hypothetical protein
MSHQRGDRAAHRLEHVRASAWLFAVGCFALVGCASNPCPSYLWPSEGRCHLESTNGGQQAASSDSLRAPWANVGRWADRIHYYQRRPRPGQERSLDYREMRTALAIYANAIHRKIHPLFAEDYLATIDRLPIDHPVNRHVSPPEFYHSYSPDEVGIWTTVEVVLRGADGAIVELGVVHSSGVDEFDAAVLETFERAAPYGAPHVPALSADGNFYLEWTFYRSPLVACSTLGSYPHLFR